jgi:CubicO group peptidase (beta-lactamase class C family)
LTRREFITFSTAAVVATAAWKQSAAQSAGAIARNERTDAYARLGIHPEGVHAIATLFASMLEEGLHPAAQLAVYRNGELAFDLAGGVVGDSGDAPVTPDTLFQIRSTTKALAAMVMMRLHDAGRFAYEDPVAKHWPEFATNGKGAITIAQVMSHRAGLPDGPSIPAAEMGNRAAVTQAVVAMTPAWEPGTANGYHASSYGWILDELVLRWEGKPLHRILREDFLDPLGVTDVYLGLPETEYPRMAKMVVEDRVRQNQAARAQFSDFVNSYAGVRLPLSWVMGVATARDLARLMSVLAFEGTWNGRQYFSKATQAKAAVPANPAGFVDLRLQHPVRWGLGFILGDTPDIYGTPPHPQALGHAGGGASVAWADPERRLAVAFLCNRMLGAESWERYRRIGNAVYAALT